MLTLRPLAAAVAATLLCTTSASAQVTGSHGWIGTRTIATPLGDFEFRGGYPTEQAAADLARALKLNRAIEAYLEQMPAVSWYNVWKGTGAAGDASPNQIVIWESLMDAETLLLTGNTETVYGLAAIDLGRDGPVVIEVPPSLLGGVSDIWQAEIAGIGPTGLDKGEGGKLLLLPPGYSGAVPDGYLNARATTYNAVLGVRGFLVEGKTGPAVELMKSIRIYPLEAAANPPSMAFVNGSGQPINTIFPDTADFFVDLAAIVAEEPADRLQDFERFRLAEIGIVKGTPFEPDAEALELLGQAALIGSAMARAQSFASTDPARLVYPDRKWEWLFVGNSATWDTQGFVNTDRRAGFSYQAIGMSPAMLQNGQPFPSRSQFTGPEINPDGSVDLYFGPEAPAGKEKNWIETVPGKGWFPLIRFYGPLQPFFDGSWKPDDIVAFEN